MELQSEGETDGKTSWERWLVYASPTKRLLLHHFAAEGEDTGLAFGVFRFGNLTVADIHLGKSGPGEEVVGLEGGGHQSSPDGFLHLTDLQERETQGVPAVEEAGV